MQISDDAVNSISPTGEELIMRIDGNYTVVREEENSAFEVVNTRCTRMNCPLLVTDGYNRTHEGLLYDTCDYGTSVDSYNGCTVLKPDEGPEFRDDAPSGDDSNIQEGDIDWTNPEVAMQGGKEVILERGETAYRGDQVMDWIQSTSYNGDQFEGYMTYEVSGSLPEVVGLTEEEKNNVQTVGGNNYMLYREIENDGRSSRIVYEEVQNDIQACEGYVQGVANKENVWEGWKVRNVAADDAELLAYGMQTRDCDDQVQSIIDGLDCTLDLGSEIVQTATGWNLIVEGGGLFGDTQDSCNRIANKFATAIDGCEGAVIYHPDSENYVCWGDN